MLRTYWKAVCAGAAIGLGCLVNLSCANRAGLLRKAQVAGVADGLAGECRGGSLGCMAGEG